MADVVSCTVYLADRADFRAFNDAYRLHFSDPLPVRTTVQAELMVDAKDRDHGRGAKARVSGIMATRSAIVLGAGWWASLRRSTCSAAAGRSR